MQISYSTLQIGTFLGFSKTCAAHSLRATFQALAPLERNLCVAWAMGIDGGGIRLVSHVGRKSSKNPNGGCIQMVSKCFWVLTNKHILYYIISYYIILYYIILKYIILKYIILYYIILCCVILYYIKLNHIILYYVMSYYIISYYIILYHITLYYIILYIYMLLHRDIWSIYRCSVYISIYI